MSMLRKRVTLLVILLITMQFCINLSEARGAIVKQPAGVLGMEKLKYNGPDECPNSATWCRHTNGESSCCPLPNAVCCADALNCCPEGTACSASGKCETLSVIPWSEKTATIKSNLKSQANIVMCDYTFYCPSGSTCCKRSSGQWGCCPVPNAVCCSDHQHCCPSGYTCSTGTGKCTKLSEEKTLMSTLMRTNVGQSWSKVNSVICPDGQSMCPDGNTCCKLSSGQWGCCPVPNAVCCSNGENCCPEGYTCDVAAGTCSKMIENEVMSSEWTNVGQSWSKVNSVICPDGQSMCPDGNTCCKLSSGQWGCCPVPNAVCCSNGENCCPEGYTCDVAAGTCSKMIENEVMSSEWTNVGQSWSKVNSVICPDGQSMCPDGNTCCKLSSGQWGCCPVPNAVCCSNGENCCPEGYTCDVAAGTCSKMIENEVMSSEWTNVGQSWSKVNSVICPDGQSMCPDGNTCCKLSSGQWGCCPVPDAVCCSNGENCCPEGYTCDVAAGTCSKMIENEVMSSEWTNVGQSWSKVNSVICPDGQSQCPDGNTCCKLSSGQWGCCPQPNAVCCSDQLHCCPNGYTCSSGGCIRSSPAKVLLSAIMPRKTVNEEQGTSTELGVMESGIQLPENDLSVF